MVDHGSNAERNKLELQGLNQDICKRRSGSIVITHLSLAPNILSEEKREKS